jgi:hypothetical protein
MGSASLGPINFRVDPMSINWGYTVRYAVTPTIGGKVIQVLGANLEDLTVTGSFGTGGWREEKQFLQRITDIADAQTDFTGGRPVRFMYPPLGYDFQVFVKAIRPISNTVGNFAPTWNLTLFIFEDTFGLTKTVKGDAMDAFITRLSEGVGWKRSEYNGGITKEEQDAILKKAGATSGEEFLYGNFRQQLGFSRTPVSDASGNPTTTSQSAAPPGQIRDWITQAMQIKGNPPQISPGDLYIIIQNESGGNAGIVQSVHDVNSGGNEAGGLMQIIPTTFADNMEPGHPNRFDPIDNILAGINYIIRRYGTSGNVPGVKAVKAGRRYVGY